MKICYVLILMSTWIFAFFPRQKFTWTWRSKHSRFSVIKFFIVFFILFSSWFRDKLPNNVRSEFEQVSKPFLVVWSTPHMNFLLKKSLNNMTIFQRVKFLFSFRIQKNYLNKTTFNFFGDFVLFFISSEKCVLLGCPDLS